MPPLVRRLILLVLVCFTLGAAVVILAANGVGGDLLGRWSQEYAGGGSCAWRGSTGSGFQTLLLLLGLPAHLTGGVAVWLCFGAARRTERRQERVAATLAAALCVAALAWFVVAGVARGALELC